MVEKIPRMIPRFFVDGDIPHVECRRMLSHPIVKDLDGYPYANPTTGRYVVPPVRRMNSATLCGRRRSTLRSFTVRKTSSISTVRVKRGQLAAWHLWLLRGVCHTLPKSRTWFTSGRFTFVILGV